MLLGVILECDRSRFEPFRMKFGFFSGLFSTMMPGETQSGAGAGEVACEATTGTCQNCTVLNQSLDEYVAAFLTLKQKIIDTDQLLSEYKEKCDELQKSQRESTKLHLELDGVLLKLGPLEKQTADHEALKAELEETKATLKEFQQKSEHVDVLREEKAKALALTKELKNDLKKAEDAANAQKVETAKLRSEKQLLEDDLHKTRESLSRCQQVAEEADDLRLQNAKTLILKSNLENQLLALEEAERKQLHEIQALRSENCRLEESLRRSQEKLGKLEKEVNKERRCSSTQTHTEPTVDKAKVRMLLEELWHCFEPQSRIPEKFSSNESPSHQRLKVEISGASFHPLAPTPLRNQTPRSDSSLAKESKASPEKSKSRSALDTASQSKDHRSRKETWNQGSVEPKQTRAWSDEARNRSVNKDGEEVEVEVEMLSDGESGRNSSDLNQILNQFRPLPAALSPMSSSNEPAEHEDDPSLPSLKNGSNMKDGQNRAMPVEPKLAEEAIVVPPVSFDTETPSDSVHTADKVRNLSSESHEMKAKALCELRENLDDFPSTAAPISLQNKLKKEGVSINLARTPSTDSEQSSVEGLNNHTGLSRSALGSDLPKALCTKTISQGSLPGLITSDVNCLGTDDKSVACLSGLEANVNQNGSGRSLNQERLSGPTPRAAPMKIKSSLTAVATNRVLKPSEDENNDWDNKQDQDLVLCTKINGVSSEDSSNSRESSAEEEFCGLKRKVRGVCSRENLDSATANKPQCNKEHECLDQRQTKDDGGLEPENKNDEASLEETNITENSVSEDWVVDDCQPETALAKEDEELKNIPKNNLPVINAHDHLEKVKSLGPENMDGSPGKGDAKSENPSLNAQEICPPGSPVNPPALVIAGTLPLASGHALTLSPSSESIKKVRIEMGPPLPPLVLPLAATPLKNLKLHTLKRSTLLSSDGSCSFKQQPKVHFPDSGRQAEEKISPCLTTPSPTSGVPSSPLQFGSATPKHAVPVPGRLPSSTLSSPSPSPLQENSMQMLDTMYPELSAQARTLNILKGNLGRSINENGTSPPSVNPISGNKTINSSSTAFTKTEQKPKRTGANVLFPKSAKRLRLDTCSPDPAGCHVTPPTKVDNNHPENGLDSNSTPRQSSSSPEEIRETEVKRDDKQFQISDVLARLEKSCFDVLPVIKSHMFLKRISDIPVLRDEEKLVISDICLNLSSADEFLAAILSKMKAERSVMKQHLLQSLCRVYVGLCRQSGDYQKAHALAYSILKEDYPEAPKLLLFMVTTWPDLLCHSTSLCRAIHTVSKLKAEGEIQDYLSMYLHWDEKPPVDIHTLISSTLKELLEDAGLNFQKHDRHGDDLCPATWEYVFSLDLLCSRVGWKWTHDHIIGKQLWPVMNTWVTQPRHQQTPVRDACVAAVLRLIGRLGQLGIKENLCSSVQNVAKAINLFGKHGISEGVPREVQLSAIYTIYDLAPSNPKEALEALASWRGETAQPVPAAVTSCITQIGSLCRQIKP